MSLQPDTLMERDTSLLQIYRMDLPYLFAKELLLSD